VTTNPNPRSKPIGELTPGEHISTAIGISRVVHVQPYRDRDGRRQMMAVTMTPVDGAEPWVRWGAPDDRIQVATEAEVAANAESGRRTALANALRALADDIVEYPLPVPRYHLSVGGALESRAELEVWARYLGVDITPGGTAGDIPVADKAIETPGGPDLSVHLQSPSEPKPEPAPEPVEPLAVEVTHIRKIGFTLANLCGHRAGPAAQLGDATCQRCNAVYERAKAAAALTPDSPDLPA
jgi:hypothetical protein